MIRDEKPKGQILYNDYLNAIGIWDDLGVLWIWSAGRFMVDGTLTENVHSGYYCQPESVEEALDILKEGGYISQTTYNRLLKEA